MTNQEMLDILACLMLNFGYEKAMYDQLDIHCEEVEEHDILYKRATGYHFILSSACEVDPDLLCKIERFCKDNPCTCQICSTTCTSFTITESGLDACEEFTITEILEDL